jgi:hypothetical protein
MDIQSTPAPAPLSTQANAFPLRLTARAVEQVKAVQKQQNFVALATT